MSHGVGCEHEQNSAGMIDRREFLGAGLAALAAAGAVTPAEAETSDIRVGCLSWCFHPFARAADPSDAIETIGSLGFDGVELILLARPDVKEFWTDAKIADLARRLTANRLKLSQFVIFQPVVEGLSSLDNSEREESLDYFEAGCRIGAKLGAPMVNIVAPWARELSGPTGYLPRYYELGNPKPNEKFSIKIKADFDWDRTWTRYVETTRLCLERAKAHKLAFSIEHHTHCLVPDAVSFLRLWDAIRDPLLGYNLDTGWTLLQREYPPVAIHKVKKQLMNVHMRDINGEMRQFVHVGTGVMDFGDIIRTLKRIGYQGFVSIEQDKFPGDMKETCARYLKLMRDLLAKETD